MLGHDEEEPSPLLNYPHACPGCPCVIGKERSGAEEISRARPRSGTREANFLSPPSKNRNPAARTQTICMSNFCRKKRFFNFFALLRCKIFELSFPVGIVVIMFQATFKYYLLELRTALLRGVIQVTSTVTVFVQAACLVSSSF